MARRRSRERPSPPRGQIVSEEEIGGRAQPIYGRSPQEGEIYWSFGRPSDIDRMRFSVLAGPWEIEGDDGLVAVVPD